MQRLCVFCGSSPGHDPVYAKSAARLGQVLAERGIGLVYGGGRVGLMGVVADAALAAGGEVIGVIPQALLERELGHRGLTELRVVDSMHARKALMGELAGGFIALPGGIGTLEELFEVWSWAQLGLHRKPCGLLDVEGFFAPLVEFLDRQVEAGFIHPTYRAMLTVASAPEELLDVFSAYEPPADKWKESIRPA
jgi:uncharacterized protein (TIGR00730 family)